MLICIIVAAAENGVIGSDGGLPWRMPSDLKRFRAMTMGKPVIMGRRTFQSLPKVLDGRDNIVVTRDPNFHQTGAHAVPSIQAALVLAREKAIGRGATEIMVIGGGEIYQQALPLADRVYLTQVHATPAGDAVFPTLDTAVWQITRQEELPRGPTDDHTARMIVYERRAGPELSVRLGV